MAKRCHSREGFVAWIKNTNVNMVLTGSKMMSSLRKQISKEIDRKGALDILDPCLRRDDIKESRGDIIHNRDNTKPNINLLHRYLRLLKLVHLVN